MGYVWGDCMDYRAISGVGAMRLYSSTVCRSCMGGNARICAPPMLFGRCCGVVRFAKCQKRGAPMTLRIREAFRDRILHPFQRWGFK